MTSDLYKNANFTKNRPFENDEERLECLFTLYEEIIAKEKVSK